MTHESVTYTELDGKTIVGLIGVVNNLGFPEITIADDGVINDASGKEIKFTDTETGDTKFNRAVTALCTQYMLDNVELVKEIGIVGEDWGPNNLGTKDVCHLCGIGHVKANRFASETGLGFVSSGEKKIYKWTLADIERLRKELK
jgi:hypothetical protein